MSSLKRVVFSQIGRKAIAGATGIFLILFLVIHLLGNLQLMKGNGDAFNEYAHFLHSAPFLLYMEVGMVLAFVLHMSAVLSLWLENRAARGGQGYAVERSKRTQPLRALASKTMVLSGVIVAAFIVVHVFDFRVKHEEIQNLAVTVKQGIAVPWRAGLYIVGSALACWHLFHGVESSLRSLGVGEGKHSPFVLVGGAALALLLGIGFVTIVIWAVVA